VELNLAGHGDRVVDEQNSQERLVLWGLLALAATIGAIVILTTVFAGGLAGD
jgi:hypothetical protein